MEDPRPRAARPTYVDPTTPIQVVIPPKPSTTADIERRADNAIRFLQTLVSSGRLNPDLRLEMNDIMHTIETLKLTVVHMGEESRANHDKLVEVISSQRLIGS